MSISTLCQFDEQLRDAVCEVELPVGWRMVNTGMRMGPENGNEDIVREIMWRYVTNNV